MSEDKFLCLILEDDDLAGLSMLDLELAKTGCALSGRQDNKLRTFSTILPCKYENGFLNWKTGHPSS